MNEEVEAPTANIPPSTANASKAQEYPCQLCHLEFKQKESLVEHVEKIHRELNGDVLKNLSTKTQMKKLHSHILEKAAFLKIQTNMISNLENQVAAMTKVNPFLIYF